MWGLVGVGLNILGAGAQADAQKYAAKVQAANQYQQALLNQQREYSQIQAGLRTQQKQNDAAVKADLQTLINTSYTAGLINLQRAQQKKQTASEIQRLGQSRLQALAQGELGAAATGTVGGSVNAVQSDIIHKMGEAKIQLQERNELNSLNYDTNMRNLYEQYMDSQPAIDDTKPDIPGLPHKYGAVPVSSGSAMLGAAISGTGNMMASRIQLNMGDMFSGLSSTGGPMSQINRSATAATQAYLS